MHRIVKPEIHRYDVLEFAQTAFQPPRCAPECFCLIFHIAIQLQLNHIQLCVGIAGKHAAAGCPVSRLTVALITLAVMMTVDGRTPGLCTDLVELIAEERHIAGAVLIAGDDLINRVDDDGIEMLIAHTAHELRHQLVQRHSLAAQIPQDEVFGTGLANMECVIDIGESVNAAGAVNFQIHIQHTALFAGEAEPFTALGDRNRQLHQQEGLTRLRWTGDQHLVSAAENTADQLLRQYGVFGEQCVQTFQLRQVVFDALNKLHPILP